MPNVYGLENFHKLNVHSHIHETSKPELMVIDTDRKIVSVLINVEVRDTRTEKLY